MYRDQVRTIIVIITYYYLVLQIPQVLFYSRKNRLKLGDDFTMERLERIVAAFTKGFELRVAHISPRRDLDTVQRQVQDASHLGELALSDAQSLYAASFLVNIFVR